MTVLRLNEFKALPGKIETLTEKMREICAHIRRLEGCEHCELLLKIADGEGDDDLLVVREAWTSIEAHKAAVSNIDPADFKTVMAMLAAPPSGQYYQPALG